MWRMSKRSAVNERVEWMWRISEEDIYLGAAMLKNA